MRKRHSRELVELFFGEVRPMPDPLLIYVLEFAGLANIGRKWLSYILFFPKLVRRHENVEVDDSRDENVPPK